MSSDEVGAAVSREFRRQSIRRFLIKGAGIAGIVAGGLIGASVPRAADYTAELRREATVEKYVCDSLLDKYTGMTAIFKGGKEKAFLGDDDIDPALKDLYSEHKARGALYAREAGAVESGAKHALVSAASHPGVAYDAVRSNFGKAALADSRTWKNGGAGALAGGLFGVTCVAYATRKRRR